MPYTVEHDRHQRVPREPFGSYYFRIALDGRLVAHLWHDHRGDDYGLILPDGTKDPGPLESLSDFLTGGGPGPLLLTPRAVAYLDEKVRERDEADRKHRETVARRKDDLSGR